METIIKRYEALDQAVLTFREAIIIFDKMNRIMGEIIDQEDEQRYDFESEDIIRGLRDSMIQRFEYSIDLLWKYLKEYLEIELKVTLVVQGPKNIIRTCGSTGILTEAEVELAIQMIDDRNMTSHIYREEIAQIIARRIPEYCAFMELILQKTNPN